MFPTARKGNQITHNMLAPSGVISPLASGPCPIGGVDRNAAHGTSRLLDSFFERTKSSQFKREWDTPIKDCCKGF